MSLKYPGLLFDRKIDAVYAFVESGRFREGTFKIGNLFLKFFVFGCFFSHENQLPLCALFIELS